jgi:hypothetical protein
MRDGDGFPVFVGEGVGFHLDRVVHGLVAGEHEVDGRIGQRRRFLRDGGDARLAGHVDVALVGFHLAHHRGEQGGLAGAVAPDHAHAVPRVHREIDVGQQQALAPAEREITEGDHSPGILAAAVALSPC